MHPVGQDGSRLDVKGVIPDLDWIAWDGRRVIIAYDTDVVTKDSVRIARAEFAPHLRGRGALVAFLEWDPTRGKGIDDHLSLAGPETVLDEMTRVDFAGTAWRKDLLRSKPQQQTLSIRVSESLRDFLELSRQVIANDREEPVSISDIAKLLLESARTDRLDFRLDVAGLRRSSTVFSAPKEVAARRGRLTTNPAPTERPAAANSCRRDTCSCFVCFIADFSQVLPKS